MRLHGRVDRNHDAVVSALRSCGWQVISLADCGGGVPDLLCCRAGRVQLVEVKAASGTLTQAQQALVNAGWPVVVVRSVEEATKL